MRRIWQAVQRQCMNLVLELKKRIVYWAEVDERSKRKAFARTSTLRRAHKDFVRIQMYVEFQRTLPGRGWGSPSYTVNGHQLHSVLKNYIHLAERVDELEGVIKDLMIVGDGRLSVDEFDLR